MPNITRPNFGRLGGYTLEQLQNQQEREIGQPARVMDWIQRALGLGGIRERFTRGELGWWMATAWMFGIATGGFISWLVSI